MKLLAFICFTFILSNHLAAAISRAEIISLLQEDYTVDKVLNLFQALKAHEQKDLADLEEDYRKQEPALAAEIVRTTGLLNQKTAECKGIEDILNGQTTERDNLKKNVQDAKDVIDSNNKKIKELEDARCASNLLFIMRLAQNQEAIKFLQYLRTKIADPSFKNYLNGNPGAFVQMKQTFSGSKTDEILSMLAQHHLLSLLQEGSEQYQGENNLGDLYNVKSRNEQQIGTGHVDNTKGVMDRTEIKSTVYDADAYVEQLLAYIDELILSFQTSTQQLQEAEQAAVQALVDYRNKVEDENFVLQRYIEATELRIKELDGVVDNNQRALDQCRSEVPPLEEGVRISQENYNTYVKNYNDRKANLNNTIDLLGQVIEIYTNEVVNVAGDEFRERADDYIADNTFDQTAAWTARGSTSAIDNYRG